MRQNCEIQCESNFIDGKHPFRVTPQWCQAAPDSSFQGPKMHQQPDSESTDMIKLNKLGMYRNMHRMIEFIEIKFCIVL